MSVQEDIVNAGFVKVVGNSGVWKFIEFSDHDSNIVILENVDVGGIHKFAIQSKGRQKVIPLTHKEVAEAKLMQNVTATVVGDIEILGNKPTIRKRRGRKSKNDSTS